MKGVNFVKKLSMTKKKGRQKFLPPNIYDKSTPVIIIKGLQAGRGQKTVSCEHEPDDTLDTS